MSTIILKRNNTPTKPGNYVYGLSRDCDPPIRRIHGAVEVYVQGSGLCFVDRCGTVYNVNYNKDWIWSDELGPVVFEESEPVKDHIPDVTKKVPETEVYGEIDGYGRDENGRNFVRVFIDIDDPKFSFQSPVRIVAFEPVPPEKPVVEIEPGQKWRTKAGSLLTIHMVHSSLSDRYGVVDESGVIWTWSISDGQPEVSRDKLQAWLNEHAVPEETA